MASKSIVEVVINGTDNFSKEFATSLNKVGTSLQKIGGILTASVTAPLVAFGVKAVDAASNLSESMNKVDVVFGNSASAIKDFAQSASTDLGLSTQAALEAAGTFGNLFTAMGIGQPVAADMSEQLLTLAADLASFNNIDPTLALEKLRAGLVGEVEPLRTLGVNLSAAAVEAKALEMGLISEGETLTAAAKAQASFALIMEQTTNAQGDFARTSEGLANQQRILKAEFENAAASLGMVLLPYALKLVETLKNAIGWVNGLTDTQKKWVVGIAAVAAAIGPLLLIVGTLMTSISAIIPIVTSIAGVITGPLLLGIAAVVAAVIGLGLAWKNNWGGIREKTAEAIEFIKNIVKIGLEAVKGFFNSHSTEINGMITAMWTMLQAVYDAGAKLIQNVMKSMTAAIEKFWSAHGDKIVSIMEAAWGVIESAFSAFVSVFTSIFKAFTAAIEGDWTAFGQHLRNGWDTLWAWIKSVAVSAFDAIKQIDWKSLGKAIIEGIKTGVTNAAKALADAVVAAAKAALDAAKGFLGIESPSKVFAQLGKNMMEGMALGVTNNAYAPAMASSRSAAAVTAQTTNNFSINLTGTGAINQDVTSTVRLLELLYG